ncbi:hypothetical protein CISG_04795 [Coccidioides immitis RMSCC 3703]|uniref:Uncharacterized protein n=2 Tax=Coccidioides immitis TaxID=5501 RepID=A0A0J8QS94_COCIT|nr:hypothetical protein CIRG_09615 [Coccidioides immitis RMSCC 2394]KMU75376.1 hypothetical protein CISG_04795 [Coccidioides immitis RMSCC 3703]
MTNQYARGGALGHLSASPLEQRTEQPPCLWSTQFVVDTLVEGGQFNRDSDQSVSLAPVNPTTKIKPSPNFNDSEPIGCSSVKPRADRVCLDGVGKRPPEDGSGPNTVT